MVDHVTTAIAATLIGESIDGALLALDAMQCSTVHHRYLPIVIALYNAIAELCLLNRSTYASISEVRRV